MMNLRKLIDPMSKRKPGVINLRIEGISRDVLKALAIHNGLPGKATLKDFKLHCEALIEASCNELMLEMEQMEGELK